MDEKGGFPELLDYTVGLMNVRGMSQLLTRWWEC